MTFHTQFSGRIRVQHKNDEKSLTQQSHKDSVNVNNIVRRHREGGRPLPIIKDLVYADVSGLSDYREALDNVMKVQGVFMSLPSSSRAFFENDAAKFLDWTFEPDVTPEMVDALQIGPPQVPVPEAPPAPVPGEVQPEVVPPPAPATPEE